MSLCVAVSRLLISTIIFLNIFRSIFSPENRNVQMRIIFLPAYSSSALMPPHV